MIPRMSNNEKALFLSFLVVSDSYLEFGTGGSTVAACSHVKSSIVSVESSKSWLNSVDLACSGSRVRPELVFADIGKVGDWGYPVDVGRMPDWPRYHTNVWRIPKSSEADMYLIDGRFRVASFAQTVLHCKPEAIIAFHDFRSRGQYHCVRQIAREIAVAEDLSIFQPITSKRDLALSLLEEFKLDPA